MAPPRHGRYVVESVTFQSEGVELVGNLYLPQGGDVSKAPAVAILGPFCYVKEQVPIQYATRLADEGFVALAFDCRTHGASKGEPRRLEDPQNKVVDLGSAVEFLRSRPEVDGDKIAALGVCEGSAEVLVAAASNPNIKAAAVVSGHYREKDNDLALIGGMELLMGEIEMEEAETRLQQRTEKAKAALEKYKATGEVEYMPIVDPVRKDVGLPWKPIWDWYHGWADRGIWENRVAIMSYVRYMEFESLNAGAAQLKVPTIMIHGEFSDGPPSAYKHFETIASEKKKLVKEDGVNHFQFYEDPAVIDKAVGNAAEFLLEHLG